MYIVSNAHFYILICASTFKTDIYMVDAIQVMSRREIIHHSLDKATLKHKQIGDDVAESTAVKGSLGRCKIRG